MSEVTSKSRRVLIEALKCLTDKELFQYADKWETLVLSSDEEWDLFYDDLEKAEGWYIEEVSLTHEILQDGIANQQINKPVEKRDREIFIKYLSSNEKSSPALIEKMDKERNLKPFSKFDPLGDKRET